MFLWVQTMGLNWPYYHRSCLSCIQGYHLAGIQFSVYTIKEVTQVPVFLYELTKNLWGEFHWCIIFLCQGVRGALLWPSLLQKEFLLSDLLWYGNRPFDLGWYPLLPGWTCTWGPLFLWYWIWDNPLSYPFHMIHTVVTRPLLWCRG